MSKKTSPAKSSAKTSEKTPKTPKKRSKLRLAALALTPLLLASGGYAGWAHFAGADAEGEEGHDAMVVAAIPPEVAAETSFTHSFALSVLLVRQCGAVSVPALKAASENEARGDGMLANLSWMAASRRVDSLTEKSCGILQSEIYAADARADRQAESIPEEKAAAHH